MNYDEMNLRELRLTLVNLGVPKEAVREMDRERLIEELKKREQTTN